MVNLFEDLFPKLHSGNYTITSPASRKYNCIAWAMGVTQEWWWPEGDPKDFVWPTNATRARTITAFCEALATVGFGPCTSEEIEAGAEKIALFADPQSRPTHVARQLATGRWASKLGLLEDIEHELRDLEGDAYGTVVLFLKRPTSS
jgi:hypothetical protein